MPRQEADRLFEELLQDLPDTWAQMAREFKAFTRARKITSPTDLMRAVLAYCGLDYTQRETTAMLALLGIEMSDTALSERLTACGPWIKALLSKLLGHEALAHLRREGRRFVVVDSSSVTGPGARSMQYRLHIEMELLSLEFLRVRITDKHTGETLKDVTVVAGTVIVADRGYAHVEGIASVWRSGGDLLIRHHARQVPVFEEGGERVDLLRELSDQPERTLRTVAGWVRSGRGELIRVWVHCWRLSQQEADEVRRKLRYAHRKSKAGPSEQTMAFAGWVMVLTTIAPEALSGEAAMAVYRCRWQVELAIKRWKSLLDVDALRGREGSPLSEVWLHGKMLYALIVDRRARRVTPGDWSRLERPRTATWWPVWKLLRHQIEPMIDASPFWDRHAWPQALLRLTERRRRRALQRLPEAGVEFLRRFPDAPAREAA